jgi:glucose/arabinose dehydrogenase
VSAYAQGLQHPRWLYVLPNGDVLVAETEAPAKPQDSKGLSGKFHARVMKHAGSGANPSANRITLLRAATPDAERAERYVFLQNLNAPIGMALVGKTLYVADSDAVLKFPYRQGQTQISAQGTKLTDLPAGAINHHWTKSLIASPDGSKLYVGVGSNSNVGENGLQAERERAAIWEIDSVTGAHRVYASGLRNPVGLAWQPDSHALWVSVNERDELGDHLPSMAGPSVTTVNTWTIASKRRTRRKSLPPLHPTTRSVRTRHRSACAGPMGRNYPRRLSTACSSGSMVPGTARPAAATKSFSCRLTTCSPKACRLRY